MNKFLQSLEITFRRDPTNFRPRVNKLSSVKDKEQKGPCPKLTFCERRLTAFCSASGNYFFLEE
jgi:ATP-binding cassette subfamily E protein 1